MPATPQKYLTMLEMVTDTEVGGVVPEALGAVEQTHVNKMQRIFEDPNIIGAGVAEKISKGKRTGDLSLCFYVRKKLPPAKVSRARTLPPVMATPRGDAVFTDVIELGDVEPMALIKRSPLQSGFSVGHKNITAGTLGAIVNRDGKKYMLSNSHVLANSGKGTVGDAIYYPGKFDGGTIADKSAELSFFQPFTTGNTFTNEFDAALAEILESKLNHVNKAIHGARTPLRVADPQRDMKVTKMGRTTGKTRSVVRDVDFLIQVNYSGLGKIGFKGQVRCDQYTAGGDSGSIVVDLDSGAIVGLHFAGSSSGSIFTPIKTVMAALNFTF